MSAVRCSIAGWFELPQDVFHPGAFKLEHAVGQSGRKKLIGFLVVERQRVHVEIDALVLLQHLQRVVDDRQRRQGEEVHLQQTDLLDVGHRIHRRDFILARLVERNEVGQRLW